MSHQTATINDTVYFWFAANDTSGSGGDGATPLYDVREAGAAAGAIPLLSGTPTLLTHANYPAGCHEIAVAATTGNGFAADDTFAVFCTVAVDSQNPSGFVGSCTLTPLAKSAEITALDAVVDTVKAETALILTDTGTTLQAELDAIQAAVITNAAGTDIAADIIALKAETALILTDTGTTLQAELDALQAAVITNAAGVDIAADIIALKAETSLIVADTNELQTDDVPGLIATLDAVVDTVKAETALIVADTNELQTDDVPGLIATLDAVVDTVKAETALIVADTNELQTDDIPTTLATLATPANVLTQVNAALDTALPASPTAGSINDILDRQEELIVKGSAATGTLSTTTMTTDLTVTVDDQFNGRLLTFRKDTTTTALRGQQTDITDCVTTNGQLTFTALTTAPVNGDTFDIT